MLRQTRATRKSKLMANNSSKPTPCRGVGHMLYATLAYVRRPATGRLKSGVRHDEKVLCAAVFASRHERGHRSVVRRRAAA